MLALIVAARCDQITRLASAQSARKTNCPIQIIEIENDTRSTETTQLSGRQLQKGCLSCLQIQKSSFATDGKSNQQFRSKCDRAFASKV